MDAVIDIGNTNVHVGFYYNSKLIEKINFETLPFSNFYQFLHDLYCRNILLCSVMDMPVHIVQYLKTKSEKLIILDDTTKLPIQISYASPQTLGKDRIALACGAIAVFPDKDIFVINAGSCITYNFITAWGEFIGGAISPGMDMRLRAMHYMTASLPLVKITKGDIPIIADNTLHSLLSGAIHGVLFEMKSYVEFVKHTYPELEVLLCGGDSRYLSEGLNFLARLEENLALDGLHKILLLNV